MKFYINDKRGRFQAIGSYVNDSDMIVLKGSTINPTHSSTDKYLSRVNITRQKLIDDGTIIEIDGKLTFTRDKHVFSSSHSAALILGRDCSGPKTWVDSEGVTLKKIFG